MIGVAHGFVKPTLIAMGTLAAADVKRLKLALAHNSAFSASAFGASSTSSGGNNVVFSAGVSSASLSAVTFSNSNNVSFGLSNGVITAIANTVGGGAITNILFSAGSYSTYRSDITFANSNGVSFGQDTNGVITATVATNYQSSGAYLTTAMASNQGSDFVQATAGFFGTNASGTIASDGISVSVAPSAAASINVSAGSTSSNVSAVTFSNGSGVTFGFDGSNVTASVQTNYQSPGAYLTTAALSQDSSKYAGTSTGMTGGSVTLNTAGIAISLPSYLTTAMASDRGSDFVQASAGFFGTNASGTIASNAISISVNPVTGGAGTGFTTATTAGTNVVGTLDTNGLSMGVPAYLTNVRLDQVLDGSSTRLFIQNTNNVGFRFRQVSTNATWDGAFLIEAGGLMTGDLLHIHHTSNDSNLRHLVHVEGDGAGDTGIHILLNTDTGQLPLWIQGATRGASIDLSSQGAPFILNSNATNSVQYLNANFLQGRLSSDMAGTNGSIVGGSFTLNTSGATISLPAYLTTAQPAGNYAGTATSVITTAGTDLSMALNTNGLTVAYPKWITTYVNDLTSGRAGTGFTSTSTAGVVITAALGTNGLSMAVPNYITTYVNDLTSGRAGTGFSTTSTAGAVMVGTLDTNGISMGVPAWLTTAMLSNAVTLSNINISAGASSALVSAVTFSNTNGVSFGYDGTNITASVATTYQTLAQATLSHFANFFAFTNTSASAVQSNTFYVVPLSIFDYVSASYIRLHGSVSFVSTTIATSAVNNVTGASTTFNETLALNAVLYSQGKGASSRSLQYVASGSAGMTWAVTVSQQSTSNASRCSITQAITFPNEGFTTDNVTTQYSVSATNSPISTTQWSNLSSWRYIDIPFDTLVSPGNYYMALNKMSGSAGSKSNDINISSVGYAVLLNSFGNMNSALNSSNWAMPQGIGSWTTNVAQTTSSIALVSISMQNAVNPFMPFVMLRREA